MIRRLDADYHAGAAGSQAVLDEVTRRANSFYAFFVIDILASLYIAVRN